MGLVARIQEQTCNLALQAHESLGQYSNQLPRLVEGAVRDYAPLPWETSVELGRKTRTVTEPARDAGLALYVMTAIPLAACELCYERKTTTRQQSHVEENPIKIYEGGNGGSPSGR